MLKIGRPNQCLIYRIHNPVGLKRLTGLRLVLAISMNIDLIIIFRIVLILYVVVALELNQPHIFTALPSFVKYSLNSLNQHK